MITIGAKARSRLVWCCDCDWREGEIAIDAMLRRLDPVQKGEGDRERERSTA